MDTSDLELIEQLLSKSTLTREKGWRDVYECYYPLVRDMVIKHNGTHADSVDIFQDGLLILNHNLNNGSFRNDSTLSTYVVSICKNLWFKEYNRRSKQEMLQPEVIIEMRESFHYLIDVEIVSVLMNELREDCRRILVEYYYNNRSMSELKDIFNVNSIQAAKNKKWRCLKYLENLFKERAVTPTWQ